ncbi:hypothetical protein ACFQL1_22175 [Halomicroarcula sp. GCM10025709]|uniref:DUF7269 family protein n=1 Tax=Halomicroarcula sp. GCM10025709 TaxID=3252669 RepID=UPI00360E0412
MRRREWLAGAGLAAFALGVIALAAPGVVGIGVRRYVVALAGLLALWQLLKLARRRLGASPRTTATPDVARTPPIEPPGRSFDAVFDRYGDDVDALGVRGRLQTRLAHLVTDVLDRYGDDATSPGDAVRSGNWTDDPEAAAFLGGLDAPSPGLGARIADRLGGGRRSSGAAAALSPNWSPSQESTRRETRHGARGRADSAARWADWAGRPTRTAGRRRRSTAQSRDRRGGGTGRPWWRWPPSASAC